MNRTAITIALASSLLLLNAPALAQQDSGAAGTDVQTQAGDAATGADRDQALRSPAEGDTISPRGFGELDINQDGVLDEEELDRYGSPAAGTDAGADTGRGERNLEFYDEDRDGAVSREEFNTGHEALPGPPGEDESDQ